ncbi:MAG: nitrate reductase [Verrucomicrobiota bacterium]
MRGGEGDAKELATVNGETVQTESKEVRSACPYCGVGCGVVLSAKSGKIEKVRGDKLHPANEGRLCTKGTTCAIPVNHPDRLTTFQSRATRDEGFSVQSPEDTFNAVADRLRSILDESGPDSLAFYVSGQISTEAQYVANKLCKGFWGTNNIDSNSRLCMASAASGYKLSFGADSPEASYEDFDHADVFLAIGSNMADCHPILFQRVARRMKESGARLIVVDPRLTSTAKAADLFLQIAPGTDLALLNGLLNGLIQRGCVDQRFIADHTEGFERVLAVVSKFPLEVTSELTGLPGASITAALDILCESDKWMSLWTMGLNQSQRGTAHTSAICNLHLLTGQIGRLGSGPFSLTGQPNAMGGREVGYLAAGLPGQRTVTESADREFVSSVWGVPSEKIQAKPGPDAVEMFKRVKAGKIRALWVIGTNPVASMPKNGQVVQALKEVDCLIVQDVYEGNETSEYAHFLFPGALWAEAEGTMVNSERRITLMQKAVDPPGDARPDWELVCSVASRMGYPGFGFGKASDVFEEVKRFRNERTRYVLDGVDYDLLAKGAVQWPCFEASHGGISKRYGWHPKEAKSLSGVASDRIRFATESGKARFVETPYEPKGESALEESLILNTGRYPHQWHTLTKTGRVRKLNELNPAPHLEIHPSDAKRLGVEDNDLLAVTSESGDFRITAKLSKEVLPGHCFAPIHWNQAFGEKFSVNASTIEEADPLSKQPALKSASVSIKVESKGGGLGEALQHGEDRPDLYEEGFEMARANLRFLLHKPSDSETDKETRNDL